MSSYTLKAKLAGIVAVFGMSIAALVFVLACDGGREDANAYVAAQLISARAFHSYKNGQVNSFSCRMYEETHEEWSFIYDDLEFSRPGLDVLIKVSKQTGQVKIIPGM